jgi:methionyl-tRNA formyltransferase
MNIIFFTQEDPFYVKIFFDEFFKHYKSLNDIKAIVISKPMGKKSTLNLARQMYNFYGPFDFIRMGCRYACVKLMGRRSVQKMDSAVPPRTYTIKQLATAYGLRVIERSDLNSKGFIGVISQYDPDLFISVASPIIFKEELIRMPKLDCINIHSAPLPHYRGMLPSFWQLLKGEEYAGITIHRIDAGIDTGDIILQDRVKINSQESLDSLIRKSKKRGAHMMISVANSYKQGNVVYRKMTGAGSYYSFPSRSDVNQFRALGKKFF